MTAEEVVPVDGHRLRRVKEKVRDQINAPQAPRPRAGTTSRAVQNSQLWPARPAVRARYDAAAREAGYRDLEEILADTARTGSEVARMLGVSAQTVQIMRRQRALVRPRKPPPARRPALTALGDAVVLRHKLRLELRQARLDAGLSQNQAAKELRWSFSKVVNLEAGHVGVTYTDLKGMLELYGVADPATLAQLWAMADGSRRQPWQGQLYRNLLRAEHLVYLRYETVAVRLRAFQRHSDGLHDLLQTPDYARCIIQAVEPHLPAESVQQLVDIRVRRQELLHRRNPPVVELLLDEPILLRPPGTDEYARKVLDAQMERLHELAALPHLDLRIVPLSRGYHPGIENPFTALDLPCGAGGIVYWEGSRASSIIRESSDEVAYHHRLFEQLAASAKALA